MGLRVAGVLVNIIFGLCYLAVGIGCLIIAHQSPSIDCGFNGSPPLRTWLFGAGVAYTIIGGTLGILSAILACTIIMFVPLLIVSVFAAPFTVAWAIVGSVSLWRDGLDCYTLNNNLYTMAMIAVIASYVFIFLNMISGYISRNGKNE